MGAFEGLFPMSFFKKRSFYSAAFLPSVFTFLMHCKQTWHKDCLALCNLTDTVLFICFLYKSNTYT